MQWRPLIILLLLVLMFFILNISLGSVNIPLSEVASILLGDGAGEDPWRHIILDFRLPRALTAITVGAGLAVCGLEMQSLFRNALAGPFVLGISSGASLGVALAVLAGISLGGPWMGSWTIVLAGMAGAGLVFLSVMGVSVRLRDNMALLIFGLMLGSITGAIVSVLQYFSKAEDIRVFLLWTFGNLGGVTYDRLTVLAPIVFIGILMAFLLSKQLNMLLLGEQYAASMGSRVKRVRFLVIISSCLLAGPITAFCGPVAFIGIAVPHLVRMLVPTANHQMLFPASALGGAAILLFCDLVSQLPGSDHVLPLNAVTSIIGAPVVIWVIIKKGHIRRSLS